MRRGPAAALRREWRALPLSTASRRALAVTLTVCLLGLGADIAVWAAGVPLNWTYWPLTALAVAGLAVTARTLWRMRKQADREKR